MKENCAREKNGCAFPLLFAVVSAHYGTGKSMDMDSLILGYTYFEQERESETDIEQSLYIAFISL